MSWFIFALAATLGWGAADLFYKKGTDEADSHSHLKTAVWVGLVMGICSFALMPFTESELTFSSLPRLFVKYSPASVCYIVSMVIGYAGMRYLEISIISPVQNASGAFSTAVMLLYLVLTGSAAGIADEFSVLDLTGTLIIAAGVISLAFVEKHLSGNSDEAVKKYKYGAFALIFPLLYCVFDTVGTAADGIILNEETGLGLGEIDVLVIYGLTFFAVGIFCWLFLFIKEKKPYNPFAKCELCKGIAAVFEEAGQVFYVFAMAAKPLVAAPMIASYCIVSVILSHIFLKEKLKLSQYVCIILVISGIVLLGISEGIAEGGS